MNSLPTLLPTPRSIQARPGQLKLASRQRISFASNVPVELLAAKEAIGRAFAEYAGSDALYHTGANELKIELILDASLPKDDAYTLTIDTTSIRLIGRDPAGAFYAAQTLRQILRACGPEIPCLHIEDSPDFPARGIMMDISRDKVPSMPTLFALIDKLAEWKINQFQLYTEHTFAYRQHRHVWQDASPMTAEEIQALDRYCRERFIELVPNQNSFGHMERWLKHEGYHDLSECPDGAYYWNQHRPAATLDPQDPRSIKLIRELHAELLPNFSSRKFNVGCDETMELGMGKCKALAEKVGRERVYLDFLLKIHEIVKSHGRQMMFWGDIILHKPELIAELPKDIVALEWGYDARHDFDDRCDKFAKSGVPFYVCPGTSSWNSFAGRTDNALENLRMAAEMGLKHGAIGYLNTDWGDNGHMQYLSASYIPFAYGAAASWCLATNPKSNAREQAAAHVFDERSGQLAGAFYDLGNVYQQTPIFNGSQLFWIMLHKDNKPEKLVEPSIEGTTNAQAAIDAAMSKLPSQLHSADDRLSAEELRNTAELLRHACRRGRWLIDSSKDDAKSLHQHLSNTIDEHRKLWLKRNRPGGLPDSAGRLEKTLSTYR